ncbi:NlpC/P60 family protein [Streptomyces collinus]|uniref:NPL/P60-family protein n=1 Tax=Streptomyces collinus (strain DSM 40733 / Tue 365) TaxID=1214242 RepID=S5UPT4_STRC3|nr:C40 family peptidase [Streptomyces collinus]AGS69063.1 NPL/P60-family protein [Streptomyces collinus Tu 365]UJA07701.1 NlpC/P60 family protein [Streptomyces collinus]UJA17433.1 NlpC/P60 family protein [Streptomyces collinus]
MGSHRRLPPSGFNRGAGAALCALSAAAAALGAVPADAAPHGGTRAEVDRLYEEAERATQAYDKADERAGTLRREVGYAQDHIARQQQRVNTLRERLGSLAGAQYRSGGIDPTVALLFSDDPGDYLDKAATLDRIGAQQAGQLRALRSALRELAQERAEAEDKLAALEQSRKAVATHKRTVERKLARARRLLASLPAAERAAYGRASRAGRGDLPGLDGLTGSAAPDARAAAALAAARSALGRPYVWGATGPSGFDCSGLMQWSYAHAGIHLPRTSQEQRLAGRRVPLSQARPGDLVVYRSDASHVAMYVGNGQVIHAPYPGAPVRYDPVGMMPVSSVTRP